MNKVFNKFELQCGRSVAEEQNHDYGPRLYGELLWFWVMSSGSERIPEIITHGETNWPNQFTASTVFGLVTEIKDEQVVGRRMLTAERGKDTFESWPERPDFDVGKWLYNE